MTRAYQRSLASTDGHIVEVALSDLGDANTSYTYFNMASEGYHYFTLAFTITATTLTLEATNDDDDVADSSANWRDLTTILTGVATHTATGTITVDTPVMWRRFRVKRVTTNANNALDLYLTRGR